MSDTIEWTRRDRADGDPVWRATHGPMALEVLVESPWCWGWTVSTEDEFDVARGEVWVGEEENRLADWNYQRIEKAQERCEAVARALEGLVAT